MHHEGPKAISTRSVAVGLIMSADKYYTLAEGQSCQTVLWHFDVLNWENKVAPSQATALRCLCATEKVGVLVYCRTPSSSRPSRISLVRGFQSGNSDKS